MKNEIILLDDVDHVGREGEVVRVAPGYARNFLVPRRLAELATKGNLAKLAERRKVAARKEEKFNAEAEGWAKKIEGAALSFEMQSAQAGRLYGSISPRLIAEKLKEATGLEIDKRMIDLPEPLKKLGKFEVPIRLTEKVRATIHVALRGPGEEEAPAEAEAPAAEAATAEG